MGKLNLPDCQETKFMKAVVRILNQNGVLQNCIQCWQVGDDNLNRKNRGKFPMLSVYPGDGGKAERVAYNLSESLFPLTIEIALAGTDTDDLLNLWDVIRTTLNDDAIKIIRNECKLTVSNVTSPAYGTGEIDKTNCLIATGIITANLKVRA